MPQNRIYFSKVHDPNTWDKGGVNVGSRRLANFLACISNWFLGNGWWNGCPRMPWEHRQLTMREDKK